MTTTTPLLPGAVITSGPQAWQVLQREADGHAPVTLAGTWVGKVPGVVEVRVASEYANASVPGCNWQDAEMLDGQAWRITLRVPTGGLYRLETRMRLAGMVAGDYPGDKIWHVAVGDVWVIAGQSNAVGYGHGPVVDPPALGVSLFGGNEIWRMATHPIFDPTGTKYPANRDYGWVDVSPWLSFAKDILQGTGVPVGLIPAALGGSPLCAWDTGDPDGAYLYDNMTNLITAAGGKVAGMVWYQGCDDTASEGKASTYLSRFTRFVETFRARYGANLPIITAQLNRWLDAEQEQERLWSLVREAQRQAARSIPNVGIVTTLDLTLADGIHTSAVGNVILGQRFARVALGMVYGQQIPWRAVDIAGIRFTNAERTAVCLSFTDVVDHLLLLSIHSQDFRLDDEEGTVPVQSARVEGTTNVVLELARAAHGKTVCHHLYGSNPACTLCDQLQRPVLAFSWVEVE